MTDPAIPAPERNILAAEYALGLTTPEERPEVERLIARDRDFARLVDAWRERGTDLLAETPGEQSPGALWPRIEQALRPAPPIADNDAGDAGDAYHGSGGWKFATLAASLAALVFAGLWQFGREPAPPAAPPLARNEAPRPDIARLLSVAQIASDDSDVLLTGVYNRETGKLTLRLPDLPDPELVPEIWVIGEGEQPRSLGFARREDTVELHLSPELRRQMVEGSSIAVSLEHPSQQVHAKPTSDRILGLTPLVPLESGSPSAT